MRKKLLSFPAIIQVLKFSSVGILNTLLDAGLYYALTRWLGLPSHLLIAKTISYSIGVVNSYFWNRAWTFQSKASARATFPPFVLTNLIAIAINTFMMYFCLNILFLHEALSFIVATGVTFLWTFTTSKLLIFSEKEE